MIGFVFFKHISAKAREHYPLSSCIIMLGQPAGKKVRTESFLVGCRLVLISDPEAGSTMPILSTSQSCFKTAAN